MKKTFSRFQIIYIHVILLLLIVLSGCCVYLTHLLMAYKCGYAPRNRTFPLQRLFPSCLLKYVIKIGESALFPIEKKEKGQGR